MRSMLISQVTRKRPTWMRWLTPWLTAVAVPAIATAGFLVVPVGDQQAAPPPGGTTTGTAPAISTPATPSPTRTLVSGDVRSATAATGRPDARAAYAACIQLVRDQVEIGGDTPGESIAGKVAKHTAEGWTVVVADNARAWACQVQPDHALTGSKPLPAPRLARVTAGDVAVADNYRGNMEPGETGDMVWAGGPLPRGVDTIRYTFPDGHVEQAVISGGFWVMHYFSPAPFVPEGHNIDEAPRIVVRLSGPAGTRTLQLAWGEDTCNQVSHGC